MTRSWIASWIRNLRFPQAYCIYIIIYDTIIYVYFANMSMQPCILSMNVLWTIHLVQQYNNNYLAIYNILSYTILNHRFACSPSTENYFDLEKVPVMPACCKMTWFVTYWCLNTSNMSICFLEIFSGAFFILQKQKLTCLRFPRELHGDLPQKCEFTFGRQNLPM